MQQSHVYYQLMSQHVSSIIMPIFRLFPYTALTDGFYNIERLCLLRGTDCTFKCNLS